MSSLRDKHGSAGLRGLAAAVLATGALVAVVSSAMAGQDQLKGGSVVFQLHGSRGLKLKPSTVNLPITGGAFDPIDGSGTVQVSGGFKAKRGKHKAKVTITSFTFGANGGPGNIAAKIGKRKVGSFGTLTGGSVTRDGWGAKIANVSASLSGKGAKALSRAFAGRKHKGAKKSGGGKVKAGPLGTIISATTVPLAVEVVPGTGTMTLNTDAMGAFVSKLPKHCVDPLPTGSPAGVSPIAPATANLLGTTYTFPVTGGSAAPDFTAGEVITGGGQTITKNHSSNPLNPGACDSAQPPVGTKLASTDIGVNFANNSLNSTAALPTGVSLRAPLADIDFSTGSRSVDPNTKKLTITGATVSLSFPAALTLNNFFPTESGNPSDDFVAGDKIGTIDVTGVKLR
jgi:hypothetical protein